jgi:hypothetical protein
MSIEAAPRLQPVVAVDHAVIVPLADFDNATFEH